MRIIPTFLRLMVLKTYKVSLTVALRRVADNLFDNSIDSTVPQSLQLTRRSNKSWHLGDEEENDAHDPFSEIGDDFDGDADDLETNLLRDKWATLCSNISRLVDLLQPSTPAASLIVACDDLVSFLMETCS